MVSVPPGTPAASWAVGAGLNSVRIVDKPHERQADSMGEIPGCSRVTGASRKEAGEDVL